jgi:hypothetical protein
MLPALCPATWTSVRSGSSPYTSAIRLAAKLAPPFTSSLASRAFSFISSHNAFPPITRASGSSASSIRSSMNSFTPPKSSPNPRRRSASCRMFRSVVIASVFQMNDSG